MSHRLVESKWTYTCTGTYTHIKMICHTEKWHESILPLEWNTYICMISAAFILHTHTHTGTHHCTCTLTQVHVKYWSTGSKGCMTSCPVNLWLYFIQINYMSLLYLEETRVFGFLPLMSTRMSHSGFQIISSTLVTRSSLNWYSRLIRLHLYILEHFFVEDSLVKTVNACLVVYPNSSFDIWYMTDFW